VPLIDSCCGGVLDKADAEVEREIMRHQPLSNVVGYGAAPQYLKWRSQARLAVNFVVDCEEGAEYSRPEVDLLAEIILSDSASWSAASRRA